jgi:hypothetical protein
MISYLHSISVLGTAQVTQQPLDYCIYRVLFHEGITPIRFLPRTWSVDSRFASSSLNRGEVVTRLPLILVNQFGHQTHLSVLLSIQRPRDLVLEECRRHSACSHEAKKGTYCSNFLAAAANLNLSLWGITRITQGVTRRRQQEVNARATFPI